MGDTHVYISMTPSPHDSSIEFDLQYTLLDDQTRQYWIYANTDNELAAVHIKVDCE